MLLAGLGAEDRYLSDVEARKLVADAFGKIDLAGKRVLVIIPDGTRTCPVGLFFRLLWEQIGKSAAALDYMVALGTHPAMPYEKILERVEITRGQHESTFKKVKFFNHEWDKPDTFRTIGRISEGEMEKISGGLFRESVSVSLNKKVFDYDQLIILGPVFPHEVVGFSGGHKYLFPGIAGDEIIHFFHWLGAVITNPVINGTKDTPTRAVVEKAASFLTVPTMAICLVVHYGKLSGCYIGPTREAWSEAADLSARKHIIYKDHTFKKVLGLAAAIYDDIWTAGKVMYKLEPVLADGAELIIYAPHITEISYTHGKLLDRIGYHTRDYFKKRMDQFADIPRGILAHSTHVRGIGTFDGGRESCRVSVVLATGIPESRCRQVNLGYRDPKTVNIDSYRNREAEGVLLVEKAGEMLYRLKDGTVPRIPGDVRA
ncbi:MAG: lactate racemase domain-containing protein [Phycisphaerae bacterium]|nr:lactate racemase domain-containing protein [Phycisphaerae bacterium]